MYITSYFIFSPKFLILHKTSNQLISTFKKSKKLYNPWTGDTSFTWRNRSKSDVYAAPTAGGFPYSSTLSREAEKVSLQENLRKEKRGLDNLHLLWMHSDMFCLSFFELLFESMSGLSLGKVKYERLVKKAAEKWFYSSMY